METEATLLFRQVERRDEWAKEVEEIYVVNFTIRKQASHWPDGMDERGK
jgi:hypothetical protein